MFFFGEIDQLKREDLKILTFGVVDSAVKSANFSYGGPEFGSQPVTPVPEARIHSSELFFGTCTSTHIPIHRHTHVYII